MRRLHSYSVAVFLVAMATLMVELLLFRVFEVIFVQHIGHMVITCAMFAVGLSGVAAVIHPLPADGDSGPRLAWLAVLLAVAILLLRPAMNVIPVFYGWIDSRPLRHLFGFGAIFGLLLTPFFLSGLILAHVFTAGASRIGRLYFFDLAGAAVGCAIWIPFIRGIGPGGLFFWAAAALVVAAAIFSGRKSGWVAALAIGSALFAFPIMHGDGYLDFREYQNKRGVLAAREAGRVELSEWDPVSRIDIIGRDRVDEVTGERIRQMRHVAYDGGSQSSHLFPFDGDLQSLRSVVEGGTGSIENQFWRRGLLVSHYLKRDTGARVLICGSAAGQETKAALLFNPSHVDGIELVETVVRLGAEQYADLIGRVFLDPRVHNRRGEARSFLRASDELYDIIQIFSNHTSSMIASGSGAATPVYLQTADAYEEYFRHLTEGGILHINHHFYPRMVSTASLAWKRLGRSDFQDHVLVYQRPGTLDTLPTMLVKMSPWTVGEVEDVESFLELEERDGHREVRVVDPLNRGNSFPSAEFFEGGLPATMARNLDFRAEPATDEWPFFNNIQKRFRRVEVDPTRFLNHSMTGALNGRLAWPGGEYSVFLVPAAVGLSFAVLLVGIPLGMSDAGRTPWPAKYLTLGYFSCLGLAFIVIELVLVQFFMKLIGFPVYTYATVILALLLSAALGSFSVPGLRIHGAGWWIPFLGIVIVGLVSLNTYSIIFGLLLGQSLVIRVVAAAILIFPLGFFMGMPFPLGVLAIRNQPRGAVAWVWGVNGVFTVIGGVLSGMLAVIFGFRLTLVVALVVYGVAMGLYAAISRRIPGALREHSPS